MKALTRAADRATGGPLFYGWYSVMAGASANFLVGGVMGFSFGVFIGPIRDELGWSVAVITIGYSIRAFESGLMAPVTGYLVDRYGPRRMAMSGILRVFAGILIFAWAETIPEYYASSLIISLGQSTGGFTPFSAAVMNWFQRRRGRAMGLLFSGNAAGYLIAPVVAVLITQFGWRGTLVIAASVILAVGMPMALVLRNRPEQYGMYPDGVDPNSEEGRARAPPPLPRRAECPYPRRCTRPRSPCWPAAITFAGPTQCVWVVHQIPHLENVGFSTVAAGFAVAAYGALQIPGRLLFGIVADSFGRKRTYIACFLAQGIGLMIFANVTSDRVWLLPLFYVFYVFGHGAYVVLS